jgi:hypothetical protein
VTAVGAVGVRLGLRSAAPGPSAPAEPPALADAVSSIGA